MKLYMTIGIPGCGKTTWVKKHLTAAHIVSRDDIRFSMLSEDSDYFLKEKEVFPEFVKQIVSSLKEGYDTVADATHLHYYSRIKLIKAVEEQLHNLNYEIIFLYFNVPLNICVERNSYRTGRAFVPEEILIKMHKDLTFPRIEHKKQKGIWIIKE